MFNIESNNSQNGGLEDYNNISDGIFPHFTTPIIGVKTEIDKSICDVIYVRPFVAERRKQGKN